MKNIAIFCDGTWQNLTQRFPTNVTRLARAVSPLWKGGPNSIGCTQVVFYDDGVGVGEGVLDPAVRLIGGTLGRGLDRKIWQAYEFICLNFAPGDRIYIFGFSRGAYTARSLAGLLRKCWILRRENIGCVEQAVQIYRDHSIDSVETQLFKRNLCYAAPAFVAPRNADPKAAAHDIAAQNKDCGFVQYLGVWDTVGALGVPAGLPFADALNDKYRFHDTSLSRFVLSARHAVSIDERRATFQPTLWTNMDALNANAGADKESIEKRPYQQIWFPGRHAAVGGGEEDGGVSIPPLLWIAAGAELAGLKLDERLMDIYTNASEPTAAFTDHSRSVADFIFSIVGVENRAGPDSYEQISDAARQRWKKLGDYRPPPLSRFSAELDAP